MSPWDAVVVGGGPAGSAAAIVLASAGRSVLVLEKDRFPRAKVCGEFLAGDALLSLEHIGARDAVEAAAPERIEKGSVHLSNGTAVAFRLPTPAIGISRWTLDALLSARAREAGAQVRFAARVESVSAVSPAEFAVRCGNEEIRARAVVGAWGRWDALDRALARGFLRRRRFFGWSRDFAGATEGLAGSVRLYLFPGGYCGLSRVEGGQVNLAGVLSERARRAIGGDWEDVTAFARHTNRALEADLHPMQPGPRGSLGTVPVVFVSKPPVENGMLMAGDAAGVIDPFSGQGQAAALASGILAAESALPYLEGRVSEADYRESYRRAWRRRFSRRFAWSAAFRAVVLHPSAGPAAARLGGERLVRLAIRKVWGAQASRGTGCNPGPSRRV
jgi:flavin-dependent dehydrogenase